MLAPALFVQPVAAEGDTIAKASIVLGNVYQNLTVNEKVYVGQARSALNTQIADPDASVWNSNLLTPTVMSRFVNNAVYAKTALIDFTKLFGAITYPDYAAGGDCTAQLTALRDNASINKSVYTMFANQANMIDFYDFLFASKQAVPNVIKSNTSFRNTVLTGNDAALKTIIPQITQKAMEDTLGPSVAASVYQKVYTALNGVGWNPAQLVQFQQSLAKAPGNVDPTEDAGLAMMKAYIRSQSNIVDQNGATVGATAASGTSIRINILGQLVTTIGLKIYQGINDVTNSLTLDAQGWPTLTADGTYKVVAYRNFAGVNPQSPEDQVLVRDITVTGGGPVISGDPVAVSVGTGLGSVAATVAGARLVKIPVSVDVSTFTAGITGYSFDITYNPAKVTPTGVVAYSADNKNGIAVPASIGTITSIDSTTSKVNIAWTGTLAQAPNTTNKGVLLKVIFTAESGFVKADGQTDFNVINSSFMLASGASNNVTVNTGKMYFGVYGDVTGDSQVTSADVTQIIRSSLGKSSTVTTADRIMAADVTGDAQVTGADVTQIIRFSLGKSSTLSTLFGY